MLFNLHCTCVRALIFLPLALLFFSCGGGETPKTAESASPASVATIAKSDYGTTTDGQSVAQYTLKNARGMKMEVISYGGIITSLTAPDKDGTYENIVLGYDELAQYQEENPFFGAIIGRYGNRIARGKFTLDGTEYTLETNNGPNHLHGGERGFDKVVWEVTEMPSDTDPGLQLTYLSPDGEGGYPGNLQTTVTYTLKADNTLVIDYTATTDQPTIVNLTQHTYFNLSGKTSSTILDHKLVLAADKYLPVDATLIPTGELAPVAGTPFDFTEAKRIGQDIEAPNDQLAKGKGFDHCWVFTKSGGATAIASLHHPATGRFMEVFTDEPAIQFYSGNFLDGTLPAPGGGTFALRSGLCLETQHYPDSPNQAAFPSVVLQPGETYETSTSYRFGVE